MQGTMTVTFIINDSDPGQSAVFVQDGLSGKQDWRMGLSAEQVRAALMVMLDGDEGNVDEGLLELAEQIQPEDPELRYIP